MAHFVRCIEGHVFDAAMAAVCPTCGARVEVAPSAAISGEAIAPEVAAPGAVFQARTPLFAAVAVLCLGIGIGSLYFVLHETRPPSATGGSPASAAADSPQAAAAPAAPDNGASASSNAVAPSAASAPTSAPTPATSTPDEATSAADANISQTLRTALDVVRMLVAFGQKNYADASSLLDHLINENNPIGMFIKAGLFMDGLGGQPKDLTQARDLLAKATQLGDPTSALFYARVLENGIGGPRDLNAAKENYLFAARGMTAGADQDLARLHLSGDVGMTALQAYQNLVSPRENERCPRQVQRPDEGLQHERRLPLWLDVFPSRSAALDRDQRQRRHRPASRRRCQKDGRATVGRWRSTNVRRCARRAAPAAPVFCFRCEAQRSLVRMGHGTACGEG